MKTATSIEEQIELLQNRGMKVADKEKAKEVLLDIGYYRLGFYWFPYEESYPSRKHRTHNLEVPGSSPGWSTLRIKHLREIASAFFFVCVNNA